LKFWPPLGGAECSKKQNPVSFGPLMLEIWSKGQFYHFMTCWFQILRYFQC